MLSGRPGVISSQKKKTGTITHGGVLMGLIAPQKCRVQRLRNLEEAEARYLDVLRKARPDLTEQVRHPRRLERRPPRKEWRPKQAKADEKPSADVNMVFVLPSEFRAPQPEELAIT